MPRLKMARLGRSVLLVYSLFAPSMLLSAQSPPHSTAPKFPAACFLFNPARRRLPGQALGTPSYRTSVTRVYNLWCEPNTRGREAKTWAVDTMVKEWKSNWDSPTRPDDSFHEVGSFDLLVLMGITNQLPGLMESDPKFKEAWIKDCSNTCFEIDEAPPRDAESKKFSLMQHQLRTDVLHNLKRDPASEPVIQMLVSANFTLVN